MKSIYNLILIVGCLFSLITPSFSQTQPEHPAKTFVGEDGKIYWNKSLPFYISLSTSPDGKEGHVMKLEGNDTVSPYYFDTEGTNWIRTRWAVDPETHKMIYPQTEVLWPVQADGVAPKTEIIFDSEGRFVIDSVAYFTVDLKISFSAKDATSGVDKIYYSTGEGFKEYTEPVFFDMEKNWDLSYYAVDKVGNVEKLQKGSENKMKVTTDGTPPSSSHGLIAPVVDNILSSKSHIELKSSDDGVGLDKIYYTIDDNGQKVYVSKISMSGVSEGEHTVTYYAVDKLGNKEEPKTIQVYVDRTAPEIEFDINGDNYVSSAGNLYVSPRSALNLVGTDNKAGVDKVLYKVDNGSYSEYSSAIPADQAAGLHKLYYYGVDKVENKGVAKSKSYIIDDKKPSISYSISGPKYTRNDTLFVNKESYFIVSPNDGGNYQSGIKSTSYTVGSDGSKTYEGKFNLMGDGYRGMKLSTSDQVANEASKDFHVFIDNGAPVLAANFSVDEIGRKTVRDKQYLIYPAEVKLFLAGTDKHVGTEKIIYRINGGTAISYSTPISGFKKGSNYVITVKLIDKLGNEVESEIEFSVE